MPDGGRSAGVQQGRMKRAYRFRLYPTRGQAARLDAQLGFACDLYNAALEQRRTWWRQGRRNVSEYDQSRQLTELRRAGGGGDDMNAWCQGEVLKRVDRAFAAFFRRVKQGGAPGFPRFRQRARYDSLTWSCGHGGGAHVREGRLVLQGVGHVKARWHRPIPEGARYKTITVHRGARGWHVCFVVEVERPAPLPPTGEDVGLDLGITSFVALSTGETVAGPRAYRSAQRQLRLAQRRVARRQHGSARRRKARQQVARCHDRIREVRRDHAHKLARELVERFDRIYVEDLNVAGLTRGWLAKDANDQGWGRFLTILNAKAEEAGRQVIAVDPKNTSQLCSECGTLVPKGLGVREHVCDCGYVADRDVNAARNVLGLGRSLQTSTVGEAVHAVA